MSEIKIRIHIDTLKTAIDPFTGYEIFWDEYVSVANRLISDGKCYDDIVYYGYTLGMMQPYKMYKEKMTTLNCKFVDCYEVNLKYRDEQ